MATGQNVIDALPIASGVLRTSDQLTAVNAAIRAAWPAIKVLQYATAAGTFATSTYDYSLSALTDLTDDGILRVYVNPASSSNEPDYVVRDYRVWKDDSTWTITFSSDVTGRFNTQTFDVWYLAKPAVLSALGDTLDEELDFSYLTHYVSWWAYARAMSDQNVDRSYRDLMLTFEEMWQRRLRASQVLPPAMTYRPGKERVG